MHLSNCVCERVPLIVQLQDHILEHPVQVFALSSGVGSDIRPSFVTALVPRLSKLVRIRFQTLSVMVKCGWSLLPDLNISTPSTRVEVTLTVYVDVLSLELGLRTLLDGIFVFLSIEGV